MLYDDGHYYKWTARADHDNPKYTGGTDRAELNRTEGYEVLPFINHLGIMINSRATTVIYQKIEQMLRYDVPHNIRTHVKIREWIIANWSRH